MFRAVQGHGCASCVSIAGALWLLVAGPATAGFLEDMVPPPPTDGVCWERVYDDDPLADHPRQKVTDLRILLQPFRVRHDFSMDIATRDRAGTLTGTCTDGPAGSATCMVTCAGDDFTLRRSGRDGAILLEIGASGGLQVNPQCAGGEGAAPFVVSAEPDDRVFLLHSTTVRTCTVQPFKPFRDHRGD